MAWDGCPSSRAALTLHRRGVQVAGAFMSPMLVIQERVAGNVMQVLLVFLTKWQQNKLRIH